MVGVVQVLLREDPSLHLTVDEDTGQTLLSGMGELHLEIAADRLRREFKVEVSLGRVMVAYREKAQAESSATYAYERVLDGRQLFAQIGVVVRPGDVTHHPSSLIEPENGFQGRLVTSTSDTSSTKTGQIEVRRLAPELQDAIRDTVAAWFAKGPVLGNPIIGTPKLPVNADRNLIVPCLSGLISWQPIAILVVYLNARRNRSDACQ